MTDETLTTFLQKGLIGVQGFEVFGEQKEETMITELPNDLKGSPLDSIAAEQRDVVRSQEEAPIGWRQAILEVRNH